jgi:hypothetical protein
MPSGVVVEAGNRLSVSGVVWAAAISVLVVAPVMVVVVGVGAVVAVVFSPAGSGRRWVVGDECHPPSS